MRYEGMRRGSVVTDKRRNDKRSDGFCDSEDRRKQLISKMRVGVKG